MEKTTDIQQFRDLFTLWLEASTDRNQESRLVELARRLSDMPLEESVAADVSLILALGSIADNRQRLSGKRQFMASLDKLTCESPRQTLGKRMLWTASVAATLLILLSIGIWMLKPQENEAPQEPGPVIVAEANLPPLHKEEPVLKKEQPKGQEAVVATEVDNPVQKKHRAGKRPAIASVPESDFLEPRVVTDPNEVIAILNQSSAHLQAAFSDVNENTCQVKQILNESINFLNNDLI